MLLLTPNKPYSPNSTLHWHGTSLYTVKGKKPDVSLLFGIPEIKSKNSRSTYMTLVLGTLFKTWQLVPTRDRGSNARSAVQPPALTGAAGWWRGRSPMVLPQHSRTCALSSRACRGACRHYSSPWRSEMSQERESLCRLLNCTKEHTFQAQNLSPALHGDPRHLGDQHQDTLQDPSTAASGQSEASMNVNF